MAAALTLGLRGHHVIIVEAAPKVCLFLRLIPVRRRQDAVVPVLGDTC